MIRGTLLAAALVAATAVTPGARAATSPYVVYEVYSGPHVKGGRVLVAGLRDRLRVSSITNGWRTRESPLGFHVVTADQAGATGGFFAGTNAELFRSATARGGRYGSVAFVDLPCAAGRASVRAGGATSGPDFVCPDLAGAWDFAEIAAERTWTATGALAGSMPFPYRLVVLDYPKRL